MITAGPFVEHCMFGTLKRACCKHNIERKHAAQACGASMQRMATSPLCALYCMFKLCAFVASRAPQDRQVGGVWGFMGLYAVFGVLSDPPLSVQGAGPQRHLHVPSGGDSVLLPGRKFVAVP